MTDTKTPATNTSEGDGKNTPGKVEGKDTDTSQNQDRTFTQADLDRIAAKTREEEKGKAKAAKEKDDRERAEKDDENQKKFEKLANDRKLKIEELEPQLEEYKAKVSELVTAELKSLPDEVKDMAPVKHDGDVLTNPLEVLAWLPKGKALAERLEGQPAKGGNTGIDPKQKGQSPQAAYDAGKQTLLNSGRYGM